MRIIRPHAGHVDDLDRRGQRRFPAVDNTAQVAWWEDGRLYTTAAQLMDVSRDGLLVLVDDGPPEGRSVSIRLIEPLPTDWIEVGVVESRRTRHGPYQLRLAFASTPSPAFLNAVIARHEDEDEDEDED